jgi:hypothetical protein
MRAAAAAAQAALTPRAPQTRGVADVSDAALDAVPVATLLAALRAGRAYAVAPGRVIPAAAASAPQARAPAAESSGNAGRVTAQPQPLTKPTQPQPALAVTPAVQAAALSMPFARRSTLAQSMPRDAGSDSDSPASTSSSDADSLAAVPTGSVVQPPLELACGPLPAGACCSVPAGPCAR